MRVTGPVALKECCAPAARVPEKSVVPVAELVASTQQAPDVAVRVTVKVVSATSYVADWAVAACGDETGGGGGVDVVVVAFFFEGFGASSAVVPLCPLFLSDEWCRRVAPSANRSTAARRRAPERPPRPWPARPAGGDGG
jgi:hypothetical protein